MTKSHRLTKFIFITLLILVLVVSLTMFYFYHQSKPSNSTALSSSIVNLPIGEYVTREPNLAIYGYECFVPLGKIVVVGISDNNIELDIEQNPCPRMLKYHVHGEVANNRLSYQNAYEENFYWHDDFDLEFDVENQIIISNGLEHFYNE